MATERLQKVMANAGIASRRACESLITSGHVTVNGRVVLELGSKVDLEKDIVEVDGRQIKPKAEKRHTYVMLYKPPGFLSVFNDERGREGLEALVKNDARLYPIGRLDADSEGLLLLTDDGELTLRLSHPRYEHSKTYFVLLDRMPGTDTLARFRRGVDLEGGTTSPSEWKVMEKPPSVQPLPDVEPPSGVWVRVILREGKKRQIRRMAASEKLTVRRLIRVQIGPLQLDRKLRPGQSRPLTRSEIQRLRMATRPRGVRPGSRGRPAAGRSATGQRTGSRTGQSSGGQRGSHGKGRPPASGAKRSAPKSHPKSKGTRNP